MQWKPKKPIEDQDSIFAIMSRLAQKHSAINLGQGFPDFDGPDWLKDAACQAIMEKPNQYPPMMGIYSLRKAVAEKYRDAYGLDYDFETEVSVTDGASEAVYLSITSLCGPGDEVVIFEPAYDIYAPIIRRAGATPVGVGLVPPDFHYDVASFQESITSNTKMVIVNSPHNPTGAVFSRQDLASISQICVEKDLIAITDEVYEHLIFKGEHFPLASFPGMRERTVTISSTAKTFSMTGWKIGYVLAPPEATDLMRKLHQLVCFAVAKPLQHAMAYGVANWRRAAEPLMEILAQNRTLLVDGLRNCGFKVHPPNGTFFLVADFSPVSDMDDLPFAEYLIKRENGIGTIPVSSFYINQEKAPKHYLRFCFAKQRETLQEGLDRLERILKS